MVPSFNLWIKIIILRAKKQVYYKTKNEEKRKSTEDVESPWKEKLTKTEKGKHALIKRYLDERRSVYTKLEPG